MRVRAILLSARHPILADDVDRRQAQDVLVEVPGLLRVAASIGEVISLFIGTNEGIPSPPARNYQPGQGASNSEFSFHPLCCVLRKGEIGGLGGFRILDVRPRFVQLPISILNSDPQGFANANFERGFEPGGLSITPQRTSSASRRHSNTPKIMFFRFNCLCRRYPIPTAHRTLPRWTLTAVSG